MNKVISSLHVLPAIQNCSDSGSQMQDGFIFSYNRDGDYVTINASVQTTGWIAVGFSQDVLMVSIKNIFSHINESL